MILILYILLIALIISTIFLTFSSLTFFSDTKFSITTAILAVVVGGLILGLSLNEASNLRDEKDNFTYKITVPKGEGSKSYYTDNIVEMDDGSVCISDYYTSHGFPSYELKHKTRVLKLNGYTLEGSNTCN